MPPLHRITPDMFSYLFMGLQLCPVVPYTERIPGHCGAFTAHIHTREPYTDFISFILSVSVKVTMDPGMVTKNNI